MAVIDFNYPTLTAQGWAVDVQKDTESRQENVQKIRSTNERLRKALGVAVDALDTVRQYYRGTSVVRPHNIAAYCDNKLDQIKTITEKD